MDEPDLIDRAKQGDVAAFNTLVHLPGGGLQLRRLWQVMPTLLPTLHKMRSSPAYKKLNSFRDGSFGRGFMRIARNKCLDQLRKRQRHPNRRSMK